MRTYLAARKVQHRTILDTHSAKLLRYVHYVNCLPDELLSPCLPYSCRNSLEVHTYSLYFYPPLYLYVYLILRPVFEECRKYQGDPALRLVR